MPRRTSACRRSRLLTTHVKRLRGGSAQCALAPISVATCEANPRTCRFSVSWLGRLLSMEMFRPRNADEGVDRDIVLTTADITTTFMIHVSRSVGPFTGGARIIAASSPSTRFTRYRRFSRGEGNVRIGSRASASGRSEVSGSDTLTKISPSENSFGGNTDSNQRSWRHWKTHWPASLARVRVLDVLALNSCGKGSVRLESARPRAGCVSPSPPPLG